MTSTPQSALSARKGDSPAQDPCLDGALDLTITRVTMGGERGSEGGRRRDKKKKNRRNGGCGSSMPVPGAISGPPCEEDGAVVKMIGVACDAPSGIAPIEGGLEIGSVLPGASIDQKWDCAALAQKGQDIVPMSVGDSGRDEFDDTTQVDCGCVARFPSATGEELTAEDLGDLDLPSGVIDVGCFEPVVDDSPSTGEKDSLALTSTDLTVSWLNEEPAAVHGVGCVHRLEVSREFSAPVPDVADVGGGVPAPGVLVAPGGCGIDEEVEEPLEPVGQASPDAEGEKGIVTRPCIVPGAVRGRDVPQFVPPTGPIWLLIIADYPGHGSLKTGIPFWGDGVVGRMVCTALHRNGFCDDYTMAMSKHPVDNLIREGLKPFYQRVAMTYISPGTEDGRGATIQDVNSKRNMDRLRNLLELVASRCPGPLHIVTMGADAKFVLRSVLYGTSWAVDVSGIQSPSMGVGRDQFDESGWVDWAAAQMRAKYSL